MNQTRENGKKTWFQAQFWPILAQIWYPKTFFVGFTSTRYNNCCKLSLYAISKKTNEPNLRKWQKT